MSEAVTEQHAVHWREIIECVPGTRYVGCTFTECAFVGIGRCTMQGCLFTDCRDRTRFGLIMAGCEGEVR